MKAVKSRCRSASKARVLLCAVALCVFVPASGDDSQVEFSQVGAGANLYAENCAVCHRANLRGTAHGPELTGSVFQAAWGEKSTLELFHYNLANMPPGESQALSETDHLAVVAYMLSVNGIQSDGKLTNEQPMIIGTGEEASGTFDSWSGVDDIDEIARNRSDFTNSRVENFRPVTQVTLNDPPESDWLSWRRTLDGQAYSPLSQINRGNVGELKLAWVVAMRDGSNQVTPLVRDGVMYLAHPGNVIQALRADTGDLIWEYSYPHPKDSMTLGGPVRNIAIYDDKIYLATYDAALIAIDARSGELVWRTVKADYNQGYTHTSGPIIGDGVVLSGINGCERYQREGCFITGHDAQTGKELWRTSTIALADDPNSVTWGDIDEDFRAGGDTWIAGSFDPALNLFFIGTSQAKPWVAASRGMSTEDAALYTNSTLALDPQTGRIVWYYQHIPGETIDMEVGFERMLVDVEGQPLLFTIGKDGILWKLDRSNGAYISHVETMEQNIFSSIDAATGRVTYRQDIREAGIGDTISACPGIYGGHNWQAMAYNPKAQSLIVPLHQLCTDMIGRAVEQVPGEGGFGGESRTYEMPDKNGLLGRLTAIDVRTLQVIWSHEQRAMFMSGALATAGMLVFIGDLDRYMNAIDVETGETLWRTRLGAPTHGYPITYAVNGEQYVAMPTGMGVFRAVTAVLSPEIYQPANGQALYVFKLP